MEYETAKRKLTINEQYHHFIEACNAQCDAIGVFGPEGRRDYERAIIDIMRDFRKCEPYKELVQNGFRKPAGSTVQCNESIDRIVRLIQKLAPKRP